jgi:aminoglycoside 3-N-acetyltransferase
MPRPEHVASRQPVGRARLAADLRALGTSRGAVVMVHASLSTLGWVVGGSQSVVEALLDVVGPEGTICAQASWEDVPFGMARWPDAWQRIYRAEMPPFDPALSAAAHYEGRLAERLRTWPGACRSANPAAGIVAVGRHARALTADHRLDDGFGVGTPYDRLVHLDGQVVLLGAPLRSISLLHHAEAVARAPKRWVRYELPVARDGQTVWREIREIDVWKGPFPYEEHGPLARLAQEALEAGIGASGPLGAGTGHCFPATPLVRFAVRRLEAQFSSGRASR